MDKPVKIHNLCIFHIFLAYAIGAEKWHELDNISYYATAANVTNRTAAETACLARGGRLALLKDRRTHEFVSGNLPKTKVSNGFHYYIGLQSNSQDCGCGTGVSAADCTSCRQSWRWDDVTHMTAERWQSGYPIAGQNRNCGTENSWEQYSAVACNTRRAFICEHSCPALGCHKRECSFNSEGIYTCECDAGYIGQHCDIDINECDSHPCQHESTCMNHVNNYTCQCLFGYTGYNCESDINGCESNPCMNNARCTDNVGMYSCICVDGYTGVNCETEINECDSNPCRHEVTCLNHVNNYTCQCKFGYTGYNCETNIDECESYPCLNNGSCTDKIGMYNCICEDGYTGAICEIEINECHSNPCQHDATCENLVNNFSCQCPFGYTGYNCETNIDDCESNPCVNNGNCTDYAGIYNCSCGDDFSGVNCEIDLSQDNATSELARDCAVLDCLDIKSLQITLVIWVVITIAIWSSFGFIVIRHFKVMKRQTTICQREILDDEIRIPSQDFIETQQ